MLLTKEKVELWAKTRLNEFTISLHGVYKNTYEDFMQNSDYDKFHEILSIISEAKIKYPNLKLRINYTFNKDNFFELKEFFTIFGKYTIDVLQIRPINNLGDTAYQEFSLDAIEPYYSKTINELKETASKKKIKLLYVPDLNSLKKNSTEVNSIFPFTYLHITPTRSSFIDFNFKTENYTQWAKRKNLSKTLFKNIFKNKINIKSFNRNLNYDIV